MTTTIKQTGREPDARGELANFFTALKEVEPDPAAKPQTYRAATERAIDDLRAQLYDWGFQFTVMTELEALQLFRIAY